jgi:hypothetical protein
VCRSDDDSDSVGGGSSSDIRVSSGGGGRLEYRLGTRRANIRISTRDISAVHLPPQALILGPLSWNIFLFLPLEHSNENIFASCNSHARPQKYVTAIGVDFDRSGKIWLDICHTI